MAWFNEVELPVGETPVLSMPDTCSGCHGRMSLEEEKVCVPWPTPDVAMRVYHPSCVPGAPSLRLL